MSLRLGVDMLGKVVLYARHTLDGTRLSQLDIFAQTVG